MRCESCQAILDVTDRFCPACGTPNVAGKLFPRFGPALREPPGVAPRPELAPGAFGCPRCGWPVEGPDPFCVACGMSLDGVHEAQARAGFIGVWTTHGPGGLTPYRSLRVLGVTLRLVLVVLMGLSAVLTVEVVSSLADTGRATSLVRFDLIDAHDWSGRAQIALLSAMALAAILFVWWMARGYRNLAALGVRRLRFGPRWAIWSWRVPFVNLVVPKEAVDDLWRASDPTVPVYSPRWRALAVPFRVHLWWMATLGAAVLLLAAEWALPGLGNGDASAARAGLGLAAAAFPALLVASVLEWMLVADVGTRQARRFAALGPVRPESIGHHDAGADADSGPTGAEPIDGDESGEPGTRAGRRMDDPPNESSNRSVHGVY